MFVIPIVNQTQALSVLWFWEAILVVMWIALFILFRAYFTENPEMDNGIKRMKEAVWWDVAMAILWTATAARGIYVFFTSIFKQGFYTVGRPKKQPVTTTQG